MKKIIFLIFILILSGCSVDYTLTINNSTAEENIIINGNNITSLPIPAYYTDQGPSGSEGDENFEIDDPTKYYQTDFKENYATFTYSFPNNEYINSTASHHCFKSLKLIRNSNNNLMLNTSTSSSCFNYYEELDEINININISNTYQVVNSNADSKINNTYIWKINRSNYEDKYIHLEYKRKPTINKEEEKNPSPSNNEEEHSSFLTYIFILMIILVLLIGIFGLIKYKSVRN